MLQIAAEYERKADQAEALETSKTSEQVARLTRDVRSYPESGHATERVEKSGR